MKDYKDIYKFPLHLNEGIGWVRDAKGQFVFQFKFEGEQTQKDIMEIINGERKPKGGIKVSHSEGIISTIGDDAKELIMIRGWGNLTGIGGHHLPAEEAANVQDTLAEFIVQQLNQEL